MATVTYTDIVQASATYCGRTIASFSASGFNSVGEVLIALGRASAGVAGMVTLSLRNATQGWRQERSLYIMPA